MILARLRAQLELGLSPLACECTLTGDHSLTVKLYNPDTGEVGLVVTGLNIANLGSAAAVQALIDELRYELQCNTLQRPHPVV